MVQNRKSTSDDYRKERRFPNLKNSSSPSGTALLLLPYPVALFPPTTISPFYCKAAVLPRNTLAAARFLRSFEKGKHIRRSIHTARENLGAGSRAGVRGWRAPHSARSGAGRRDAGASRGAAIPPRPQGQGLPVPAAGRRSDGSRPGPAITPPPGRAAAAAPGRGRRSQGPASARVRAAARAGNAERATYFPPAAGAPAGRPAPQRRRLLGGGGQPCPLAHGRCTRPRSTLPPTSARRRASVRSGCGSDDSLPAATLRYFEI